MMRKLAMAMVVSGALGSSFASAMGLGEIKMNSALNQPLDAEVTLLNVGDLSENQILPNLASHEDFARAGVERVFFLSSIKFDVELDGKGGAILHLSTDRIVREPFLNFLIELHWPSGRLLREYTALLDPPLFSEAAPAPVQQAVTVTPAKPAPKTQTYNTPAASQSNAKSMAPSASSGQRDGSVRVKKNDTLWGIAKENRPDSSVTVRQTMVAIQQHNPQAFINNNINLLKSGQVLRIPETAEIRRISSSEANAETVRQTQEWEGKKTIDATQSYDSPAATDASTTNQSGLLKLVATDVESIDEATPEDASGGSEATGASGAGNQSKSDNNEVGSGSTLENVDDLEKELQNLQRLMSLKQEQLALLQATNAQNEADAELAAENMAKSEVEVQAATQVMLDNETAANVAAGEAQLEINEASEPEVVLATNESSIDIEAAAAKEARPEQGVMDILMNNPLYIAILLVVILGALILLGAISRRRKEEQEYPQDHQEAIVASDDDAYLPDELEEDLIDIDAVADDKEVFANISDADALLEDEEDTGIADSRKLLEEADIYIAYGRYERALEILQPAANNSPKDTALHLKLAEIFLATRDEAHYSQQEADLQAIGDAGALAKLDELKAKYADAFDELAPAMDVSPANPEESTLLDDLDFDLSETEDVTAPENNEASTFDDNLVEFDMDSADDFLDIDAENSSVDDSDNALEFSLNDEDDELLSESNDQASSNADDMDFLIDTDESATKLELAKAYIDMADTDAAQEILNEVVSEGSEEQQNEAKKLLEKLV